MSDLFAVDSKVQQGLEWRGTVEVEMDGESLELQHRDLDTEEFSHTMDIIGEETFADLQERFGEMDGDAELELDESDLNRIDELQSKDELTDEEQAELAEYSDKVGGVDQIMAIVSTPSIVEGCRYAAKLAVVPDDDDIDHVMDMTLTEQEETFGETAKTRQQARKLAKERVKHIVDNARPRQGFTDIVIGLNVVFASTGGN